VRDASIAGFELKKIKAKRVGLELEYCQVGAIGQIQFRHVAGNRSPLGLIDVP
jgi:hypothetical protein